MHKERERERMRGREGEREREKTHRRIAMNEKANMAATTFIFSEIPTSGYI